MIVHIVCTCKQEGGAYLRDNTVYQYQVLYIYIYIYNIYIMKKVMFSSFNFNLELIV